MKGKRIDFYLRQGDKRKHKSYKLQKMKINDGIMIIMRISLVLMTLKVKFKK